ncbi:MAG: hypothetical protein GQ570_11795 [Helicobacteraceae bacterium]|nr:hypothetical protein [Helicobacteraceae bacterium]
MAIGKISEEIRSAQDYLLEGATVPQNTTLTGVARQTGGTQSSLEIVAIAETDIVITDLKIITVSLTGSDTEDGTFVALVDLYTATAAGATTIDAGTELGRYVPKHSDPMWIKAVIVTDDVAIVGTATSYIRNISR